MIEHKGSLRAVWQADIRLEGVPGADDNRLARAHSFADTARVLATTRGACAWMALGHAPGAYDAALRYAWERHPPPSRAWPR